MAGDRQLLFFWDSTIDGAFRRRLEAALRELGLHAQDGADIDTDPDAPTPIRISVSAPGTPVSLHGADLLVIGGDGEAASDLRANTSIVRLHTSDIRDSSRAWKGFVGRLRALTGRPSLGLNAEALREQLHAATQRADEAERARAQFELERNDAIRAARRAEADLAVERAETKRLRGESQQLQAAADDTTFALALVPETHRAAVHEARRHAWRARLAAADAAKAADAHPDALAWKKPDAVYSGETRNGRPHGLGVQTIRANGQPISTYRGEFAEGQRHGHGVAEEAGGHIWSGQWRDGEAVGFGCLDASGGRRFEGETKAGRDGEPVKSSGFTWEAPTGQQKRAAVHTPVATLLPAPDTQASGG